MPAPTNTTACTATAITSLPYVNSQNVHDAGTTYTVWYSYTATADGVLGLWGFGDLTTYTPTLEVFTGPNCSTLSDWPASGAIFAENKPSQFPVFDGSTYWFRFTTNAGNPTPAVLQIDARMAVDDPRTGDRFIVNDDTEGFPAAIINASSGTVIGFVNDFPAGEGGDLLPTGEVLISDAWNGQLRLYDLSLTTSTVIAFDIGFSPAIRAQRTLGVFYVGTDGNPVVVKKIDSDGTILSTITLTGRNGLTGLAASNDGTIIYNGDDTTNQPLRRWIVGSGAGSDLAAAAGANIIAGQDILVLADDTILASNVNMFTGAFTVKQYNDGGTVLNTYTIATTSFLPASTPPRLAYGRDDTTFWVWFHMDGADEGKAKFQEIQVSDGTVLRTTIVREFESGVYQGAATATPDSRFGISFSCPFFMIPGEALIVDLSEECCPCDCPEPIGPKGSQATAPLPSHTGQILPPVDVTDWTPQCTGGGDVPSAADATDPESWVM